MKNYTMYLLWGSQADKVQIILSKPYKAHFTLDPKYLCIYCISILLQLSLRNAGSTTQDLGLISNALVDPGFTTPPTSLGVPTS